jgi:hypothetical protein
MYDGGQWATPEASHQAQRGGLGDAHWLSSAEACDVPLGTPFERTRKRPTLLGGGAVGRLDASSVGQTGDTPTRRRSNSEYMRD